jgi:hypothetical protein
MKPGLSQISSNFLELGHTFPVEKGADQQPEYPSFDLTPMKTKVPSFLITILIAFLSQNAHAVSPPPDGGYPGANTAEGDSALLKLVEGTYNTAVGYRSLSGNTNGTFNTALGAGALLNSTNATENTATGAGALLNNATPFVMGGNGNTADGAFALFFNTTGSNNTAIGDGALLNNTSGSGNTALGQGAGSAVTSASNVICIGTSGINHDNSCFIGNIFGATVSGGAVVITSSGRLGTITSSRRFKEEVKLMERASEALYALKPVTFRYKKEIDPTGTAQFGLVAEEVEKVNPDLVVRDKDGKPYSVRYDQVNAMLLNEFLKEHRKNEEQDATIARQQKQIAALTAGLQKVSAQLEAGKSATQLVNNP